MLKEVWVSAAGSTYRAAAEDFINAQIPFYYSGSWQVANLSTKIGDAFDWVATGSPCGPAACSGLQGGAALVAIKYTKNPEEVAKVLEYLASEPVVKEFTERTLFLPAHAGRHRQGRPRRSSATTRTSSPRWRNSSPPPSSSPPPPSSCRRGNGPTPTTPRSSPAPARSWRASSPSTTPSPAWTRTSPTR